jgi:hypothetical protein
MIVHYKYTYVAFERIYPPLDAHKHECSCVFREIYIL